MIDLAENDNGHFIPLKDVSARQGISKKYLEIITRELSAKKLLLASSGKNGGYKLARKPEEYTVWEILELMENTLSPVICLADPDYHCPRRAFCKTLPMWTECDHLLHDFFYRKKLSDLLTPRNPVQSKTPSPPELPQREDPGRKGAHPSPDLGKSTT